MTEPNPFKGVIQRALVETQMPFLMMYYLPTGGTAGSQISTGSTYYLSWLGPDGNSAAFGVLNYVSRCHGRPLAYTYRRKANGYTLSGYSVVNYPTTTSMFTSERYIVTESELPSLAGYTSTKVTQSEQGAPSIFQLTQVNTNVPENEIYSGVWYRMSINNNAVVPPVFNLPAGGIGSYPFPQDQQREVSVSNSSLLMTPWVTFIPFTQDMSYWSGGSCQPAGGYNTAMLMYNDWIWTKFGEDKNTDYESHYTQKHCYGKLGSNSRFCAYIGQGCNGGLGYTYCESGKKCGKCFGACNTGYCIWDSSKSTSTTFYCAPKITTANSNTDTGVTTKNKQGQPANPKTSKWTLSFLVGIVVLFVCILLIYYTIGHVGVPGKSKAFKTYTY
jgi:hypothetical protein